MTELTKTQEEALGLALQRVRGRVGQQALEVIGDNTFVDPQQITFVVGEELTVPEEVQYCFANSINGSRPVGGVMCTCGAYAKQLYFGALVRRVPEYDEDMQPTGRTVEARTDEYHDVFDAVMRCAGEREAYDIIRGRTLRVAALLPVRTARFNGDRQIVGTRQRSVPVFTFVETEKKSNKKSNKK